MSSQEVSLDEIQRLLKQLKIKDNTCFHDIESKISSLYNQLAFPHYNYPDVSKYRVLIILGCPIIKEDLFEITHFLAILLCFQLHFCTNICLNMYIISKRIKF